jgi:hypothetical protein
MNQHKSPIKLEWLPKDSKHWPMILKQLDISKKYVNTPLHQSPEKDHANCYLPS